MIRPDLRLLSAPFARPPVTRFAPSPIGYLLLGHVVNAIYVWGLARELKGHVLLRIEDHDRRPFAGGLDGKIAAIKEQLDEAKQLRAEAEALRRQAVRLLRTVLAQ